MMRTQQKGFTLIELVVVIVILGILAATALPKFVDLSSDASTAAVAGVAGAISSAGSINYAKAKSPSGGGVAITDVTDACAGAANSVLIGAPTLLSGSVTLQTAVSASTTQYQIIGGATKICAAGVVIQCTIKAQGGQTATAFVPCTT